VCSSLVVSAVASPTSEPRVIPATQLHCVCVSVFVSVCVCVHSLTTRLTELFPLVSTLAKGLDQIDTLLAAEDIAEAVKDKAAAVGVVVEGVKPVAVMVRPHLSAARYACPFGR
jgi:hypothetical protein